MTITRYFLRVTSVSGRSHSSVNENPDFQCIHAANLCARSRAGSRHQRAYRRGDDAHVGSYLGVGFAEREGARAFAVDGEDGVGDGGGDEDRGDLADTARRAAVLQHVDVDVRCLIDA
jgi:hypothetical protein